MPRYKEAKKEALQELTVQAKAGYLSIPCLMGGVGIGKTEMAADLAIEVGNLLNDELLFEAIATGEASDPTDTAGIPWILPVEGAAENAKEFRALWVLNRAAYQACKVPTLLLFDDIDKANSIIINSLLNLFVHRRFKDYKLHEHSVLMAAGNRTTDDSSAHALSESIRTRVTIIEVEPSLEDFADYGKRLDKSGKQMIDPLLLGFLAYRPELLHSFQEGVYRFPTPRGYRETSLHLQEFPDPKGWGRLLERKLGTPAMNDFMSWYHILSQVDVEHILDQGTLKGKPKGQSKMSEEVAAKMAEFAAVFAVTDRLNKRISGNHAGLEKFCLGLSHELQVAFLLQLQAGTKSAFRNHYPKAAGSIMGNIIKDSA